MIRSNIGPPRCKAANDRRDRIISGRNPVWNAVVAVDLAGDRHRSVEQEGGLAFLDDLYALEVAAGLQLGPYSDDRALQYARRADLEAANRRHRTVREQHLGTARRCVGLSARPQTRWLLLGFSGG